VLGGQAETTLPTALYGVAAPGNHGYRHHLDDTALHAITVCANVTGQSASHRGSGPTPPGRGLGPVLLSFDPAPCVAVGVRRVLRDQVRRRRVAGAGGVLKRVRDHAGRRRSYL
jgi:hypothetical protein